MFQNRTCRFVIRVPERSQPQTVTLSVDQRSEISRSRALARTHTHTQTPELDNLLHEWTLAISRAIHQRKLWEWTLIAVACSCFADVRTKKIGGGGGQRTEDSSMNDGFFLFFILEDTKMHRKRIPRTVIIMIKSPEKNRREKGHECSYDRNRQLFHAYRPPSGRHIYTQIV